MSELEQAWQHLAEGFSQLPQADDWWGDEGVGEVLLEVAERMRDNYPYFHPLYVGQMLKPPHRLARLAYSLAQNLNPNNHALDGGRASSALEKEAVAALASMVGWQSHLGHLTSGGTFANLEALWISGQLHPGKKIAASCQAHYTHQRISQVLKLPFISLPCGPTGRLCISSLEQRLAEGEIGTVVATLGTTAVGAVDPLPEILQLCRAHGVRCHVDAAYGGYFKLASRLSQEARRCYDSLGECDSLVIDPHKHGLQPYGCGCVLFRDPQVGRFYSHDSPYTYFSSAELHLGEISLECSRAGASAVALWATQRLLPPVPQGRFAQGLDRCLMAALQLSDRLRADQRWRVLFEPQLDIVIWCPQGSSASAVSRLSQRVFEEAARQELHLALTQLTPDLVDWPELHWDTPRLTCLRSCLMKPEHLDWVGEIAQRLSTSLERSL